MNTSVVRSLLAVGLGVVIAIAVIFAFEYPCELLNPLPPGADPHDAETVKQAMAKLPDGAWTLILAGWGAGTFAGAWVTARVADYDRLWHGMLIGVLFMAAGINQMMAFPHPIWFWVIGIALFLPAAFIGSRLAVPRAKDSH